MLVKQQMFVSAKEEIKEDTVMMSTGNIPNLDTTEATIISKGAGYRKMMPAQNSTPCPIQEPKPIPRQMLMARPTQTSSQSPKANPKPRQKQKSIPTTKLSHTEKTTPRPTQKSLPIPNANANSNTTANPNTSPKTNNTINAKAS